MENKVKNKSTKAKTKDKSQAQVEAYQNLSADDRRNLIITHIQVLAKAKASHRRLVVNDYNEYREKHAPEIPAMTTVYREFGSWKNALIAAELIAQDPDNGKRTSQDQMIQAMIYVAKQLSTEVLSTGAYDKYRKQHKNDLPFDLPSSSVIRKWLGHWEEAVKQAGLKAPHSSRPRKMSRDDVIKSLRRAKDLTPVLLSEESYKELIEARSENHKETIGETRNDNWPTVHLIKSIFPSWEAALSSAEIEQSDYLHPEEIWTAEEARQLARLVQKVTEGRLEEASYEKIRDKSRKPLPSWKVLNELLNST